MTQSRPMVEMHGIKKSFGSTQALRGVDFTVLKGEVHALLGRNGAGKSTLVSALSGFTPADAGTLRIADTEIRLGGQPYLGDLRNLVAHVQQTPRLFDLLSVAENLYIENPVIRNGAGAVSHRKMIALAAEALREWEIDISPTQLAGQLGAGARQLLEIIKALIRGVPLMILDEPTAALSNAEKRILFRHVRALKERGVSFVYISHHLDEIFEVADTVTILRDGMTVLERGAVSDLDVETIARLMMGKETARSAREDFTRADEPLIICSGISVGGGSINVTVRAGEIVALAGPVGGGKEDLGLVLSGAKRPVAGTVQGAGGKPITTGLVPSDRHVSGYVGILGVRENIALSGLDLLATPLGFLKGQQERELVGSLSRRATVVSSSLEQPVGQLSGGNQQKVVFARSLCRDPDVVVALSPTRGVDVGAKEQLYALLRDLARQGKGIVVVSDEEDEISQLANRVIIVSDGEVVDELIGDYSMKDLILRMEGIT